MKKKQSADKRPKIAIVKLSAVMAPRTLAAEDILNDPTIEKDWISGGPEEPKQTPAKKTGGATQ